MCGGSTKFLEDYVTRSARNIFKDRLNDAEQDLVCEGKLPDWLTAEKTKEIMNEIDTFSTPPTKPPMVEPPLAPAVALPISAPSVTWRVVAVALSIPLAVLLVATVFEPKLVERASPIDMEMV